MPWRTITAYFQEPPWAKHSQRTLAVLRYLGVVLLGVYAALSEIFPAHGLVGAVLVLTGLCAIGGVVSDHYRFEWVALSPMISALLIAGVAISFGYAANIVIILVLTLVASLGLRLVHLTLVASRLRMLPPAGRKVDE